MLAENDFQLSKEQIKAMLHPVVDGHLTKLDRVAAAAKSSWTFDVQRARADDLRACWAYKLLDAQGFTAVVRPEVRAQMAADGLSKADIEAVQDHLAMLRLNELVPTKPHILEKLIEGAKAHPTAIGHLFKSDDHKAAMDEIARSFEGDAPPGRARPQP